MSDGAYLVLDGASLTVEDLVRAARDPSVQVLCDPKAMEHVARGRARLDALVAEYRRAYAAWQAAPATAPPPKMTYGVTTGFGLFKNVPIPPDLIDETQRRLLRSHMAGVGDNAIADDWSNYFPAEVVRAALLLRLNALLKGHSGVRPVLLETIVAILNAGVIPLVPTRGSLGASGDLCPLSHLFGVLLGEGRFYVVRDEDGVRAGPHDVRPAAELAAILDMPLPTPAHKEGLALNNGTSFSTALLALAVHDARILANTADTAAALAIEAVGGRTHAFDPRVHAIRGHAGQIAVATHLRALLNCSKLINRSVEVQDVYSLRCVPQVHGASRDALDHVAAIVQRELNAATDNPLFFPDDPDADEAFSAGNFHGQPIALAADYLAIAVAEFANISERRTQMLLDANHNRGLPANLVVRRGVNSGYMIAQYTAAALVSENKVLAHPASVDSIPSSANSEDHVSMSLTAARKLRLILANAQAVIAIELMVSAQAVDWRAGMSVDPNETTRSMRDLAAIEAEATAFAESTRPDRQNSIITQLGAGTRAAYEKVRAIIPPLLDDRPLDGDIIQLRRAIETESFGDP